MEQPILCLVIPAYNEEKVLPLSAPLFLDELQRMIDDGLIASESKILFVDDGSKDATWDIITSLSKQDTHFCGIRQSRNRGHQNALVAGLMNAREFADIAISADCDGQDDISALYEMVQKYHEGFDVVYGVRSSRATDTAFKRNTAQLYYKLLAKLGADVVYNHADYRLTSKRVLDAMQNYQEVNLFLRGLFPLIGFSSTTVSYERHERMAGSTHYPLSKMVGLAVDGITSLSTQPIKIIQRLGIGIAALSLIGIIWAIVIACLGKSIAGWASLVCVVCLLGGIQLISIGIIGEYVGKTYMESKHRPRYVLSDTTENFPGTSLIDHQA